MVVRLVLSEQKLKHIENEVEIPTKAGGMIRVNHRGSVSMFWKVLEIFHPRLPKNFTGIVALMFSSFHLGWSLRERQCWSTLIPFWFSAIHCLKISEQNWFFSAAKWHFLLLFQNFRNISKYFNSEEQNFAFQRKMRKHVRNKNLVVQFYSGPLIYQ